MGFLRDYGSPPYFCLSEIITKEKILRIKLNSLINNCKRQEKVCIAVNDFAEKLANFNLWL